jgi:parvulin-like peptidyl-prolyl isomerase
VTVDLLQGPRRRAKVRAQAQVLPPALRRIAREPLLHFFAAGLALFVAAEHHRRAVDLHRIVVTPQQVRQLADGYGAEFGVAPSPQALAQLVDGYVDQEVLYREGLARGLDRDDEVVRRRVVQKMQFLAQDLAPPRAPSEADIQAWFAAHRASYAAPASVGFSHIYFTDGSRGPEAARRRAAATLSELPPSALRAPERGDPFPDLYDYAAVGADQARRLFGDTELSRRLFEAPAGRWAGPFRSAFGWHLVRVQSRTPARPLTLAEARERVVADLMEDRAARANGERFARLKARYAVERPARP